MTNKTPQTDPAAASKQTFNLLLHGKPFTPHNGRLDARRVNGEGGQRRIIRACLENFIVVCAFGRSFGKTVTALLVFWEEFRRFGVDLWPGETTYDFAYCAPTRANHAVKIYRQWKEVLAPLTTWHSDVELVLHIQLGSKKAILDFWGLDEHDSHRGARKHRIIIDEAKDVVEQAFSATLLPMTLGRAGRVLIQGTPGRWGRGNAWFRAAFRLGEQRLNGYLSLTAPSHDNPFLTEKEINDLVVAKMNEGGEKTVREEIFAQWLSDEGSWFSNLAATFSLPVLTAERWGGTAFVVDSDRPNLWTSKPVDAGDVRREPDRHVAGLDFGILDATVWTLFNRRTRHQIALARFQGDMDYTDIIPAIDALQRRFGFPTVIFDASGGHGGAVKEHLARHYHTGISGKAWSFKSKVADLTRAQALCSLAGTDKGWSLINVPWQRSEFESFQATTTTRTGAKLARPQLSAPLGLNDDSVTAAALAATMLSAIHTGGTRTPPPAANTHDWYDAMAAMYAKTRSAVSRIGWPGR